MRKNKKANKVDSIREERERLLTNHHEFYITEAYKALRTNVIFSLAGEKSSHVIMVTSSFPSEGKTTTSSNLALSLAEAGKHTLIVDCDLRKPKLGRLFNVKSDVGLTSALMDQDKIMSSIFQMQGSTLYIMPAGHIPPNPSELLSSKNMKNVVETLRNTFDYVILDTPPVNVVTDAIALSPYTDGTLFVVRSGRSERNAVQRALDQLSISNTKILGVVMTDVAESAAGYGAYDRKYEYAANEDL